MFCRCCTSLLWRGLHPPISNWCIIKRFNFMVTILWLSIVVVGLMLKGPFWLIVAIFMYSLLFLVILEDLLKIRLRIIQPIHPVLCRRLLFFPFVWWIERWVSISLRLIGYVCIINHLKKWAIQWGKLIVSLWVITQSWWWGFFRMLYNQAKMLIKQY